MSLLPIEHFGSIIVWLALITSQNAIVVLQIDIESGLFGRRSLNRLLLTVVVLVRILR